MLATASRQAELYSVHNSTLRLLFHPGQTRAWESKRRFPFVISGTQGGKTSFGPWWLDREIDRCGPGDYIAVTATYDLFKLKMLPEMLAVWNHIRPDWTYQKSERVLLSKDQKTRIILRSADSPGGLESSTAKAAWMDECGQDSFTLEAWEAVQRRLSLHQGRALGTTTPYNFGWLKTEIYDRWAAHDATYDVVQFKSIANPRFPKEEYYRAQRTLATWKFEMFYNANFTRPAGMIYDCFNPAVHVIDSFEVPKAWPRYGGLDFGGVNTAAVKVCENPDTKILYITDEYLDGEKTAKEHKEALDDWGCGLFVGGSWSEGQWRLEFQAAGMPIVEPDVSDVETGIMRVYSAFKEKRLYITRNCKRLIDGLGRYSRPVDSSGNPLPGIKDKQKFHLPDATRYIMTRLNGSGADWSDVVELGKVEEFVSPWA